MHLLFVEIVCGNMGRTSSPWTYDRTAHVVTPLPPAEWLALALDACQERVPESMFVRFKVVWFVEITEEQAQRLLDRSNGGFFDLPPGLLELAEKARRARREVVAVVDAGVQPEEQGEP